LELAVRELDTVNSFLGQKNTEDVRGTLAEPLGATIAGGRPELDFAHASGSLSNKAVIHVGDQVPLRLLW
jgi:hypothetical protein